jgi:hypothetical protein
MGCGCAERRAAINAAVKDAWHRVRGLALMTNDRIVRSPAAERIAQRAGEVHRQHKLLRMSKRSRESLIS